MSNDPQNILLNHILALMVRKIIVPSNFHGQVIAVKEMLQNDVSGLVDSLTDFAVETATVDFNVETSDDVITGIFNTWLERIKQWKKDILKSWFLRQ